MRLIILTEEESMKVFLQGFLKRLLPTTNCLILAHEGKADLRLSIPRKLRTWQSAEDRFLVMRDNDGADCRRVKDDLVRLCEDAGKPEALVRIVCQELECWFLGDLVALEKCFDQKNLSRRQDQAKYRDPDSRRNGAQLLKELIGPYGKVDAARRMAEQISVDRNCSRSFQIFVAGVRRLASVSGSMHGQA